MAMSSLWHQRFNDIDWSKVNSQSKRLSQAARRNLIAVSAICATGGTLFTVVALIGGYSPRATYCDERTKPCTEVEVDALEKLPLNVDAQYLPSFGLQRTSASVLATILFGGGLFAIAKAEEEQEEIEPELQLEQQIKIKRLELEANTELVNLENLAQTRVEVHEQELKESVAEMFFERNPEAIAQYLPKDEPVVSPDEAEEPLVVEEAIAQELEPEVKLEQELIPPGIEMMLESDLREIVDAGILNLVGAQGSGKTTTSCMLLRYRVWKGHSLIVVNPHKKKSMYQGLESHLMPGTKFYGVGKGDVERAQSLLDGLEFIRQHISDRYDEYQNLDESEYDHFPVTILLEECAEYDGLLSVFNRPANPKESDPGFSAKRYVTSFWKKFFIATRKGNNFGIRTIQFDSNTMNGTDGMADLIKSQGACKLTQYSVPDGICVGGWRSTGQGEIELPNQKYFDSEGKPINAKPATVPTWFDYKKVLDPTDFRDLAPILSLGQGVISTPAKVVIDKSQEFEASDIENVQHPMSNPQSPMPDTQSHDDDISPEEMLKQNLDRLVAGFEHSLVQSVNSKNAILRVSHPEIEEIDEPTQAVVQQPESPALPGDAVPLVEEKRFTPIGLSRVDLIAIVKRMQSEEMSQTKIVEQLWQCKKSAAGWSKAYREFRSLGL
ncbi:MAG: ATP-binding protein [Nostoc sp.]|uniref:ATP-binding protein n=1 Tax=Nostoc sp. TaxID=1180 RepID=UPI002FF09BA6